MAATGVIIQELWAISDGLTLYIGDFSTNVIQVWTNSNPTVSAIEDDTEAPIVAKGFKLYQAYPNPLTHQPKLIMK